MKTEKRNLSLRVAVLIVTFFPIYLLAGSAPEVLKTENDTYNGGFDNSTSISPLLGRIITGLTPIQAGVGGWVLTDQSPTIPYEYWTNTSIAPDGFCNGDTLVFADGDSISLWTSIYPGYLDFVVIYDIDNAIILGGSNTFKEATTTKDSKVSKSFMDDIQVFSKEKNMIQVISSSINPIKEVTIMDALGRILFSSKNLNVINYETSMYDGPKIVLVKVVTENGLKYTKVLIK